MTLTLSLIPLYLLGNLHCAGMCGPLVMTLARNRYKYWYFFGRLISYGLAGLLAGGLGELFQFAIPQAGFALAWGGFLILIGAIKLSSIQIRLPFPNVTALLLKDTPLASGLFGFLTLFLPCGQTLIVFASLALIDSYFWGLINGLLFACLTSPSLILAMRLETSLKKLAPFANQTFTYFALGAGLLTFLRGLSDLGVISHLVLSKDYHIILW